MNQRRYKDKDFSRLPAYRSLYPRYLLSLFYVPPLSPLNFSRRILTRTSESYIPSHVTENSWCFRNLTQIGILWCIHVPFDVSDK